MTSAPTLTETAADYGPLVALGVLLLALLFAAVEVALDRRRDTSTRRTTSARKTWRRYRGQHSDHVPRGDRP